MKPREAADVLRVSKRSVYRMIEDGRLSSVRLGDGPSAQIRVPASAVANLIRAGAEAQIERRDEAA
jgi:excisionase family DNA binding protein